MAPILMMQKELTDSQKRLRRVWRMQVLALQDTTEYSAGSSAASAGEALGLLLAITKAS